MKDLAILLALLLSLCGIAEVHHRFNDVSQPLVLIAYSAVVVVLVGYASDVLWRIFEPRR